MDLETKNNKTNRTIRKTSIDTRTNLRPKNFHIRVFRNGENSHCAYVASCTIEIVLTEATRKLSMTRRAERLFDSKGREIFQSTDIKKGEDYYVTSGEHFQNPLSKIRDDHDFAQNSTWTIDGIVKSSRSVKLIKKKSKY